MPALAAAAIMALVTNPQCGGVRPDTDLARRVTAIAINESSGNPFAVHVNGPDGGARFFDTATEAVAYAQPLIDAGRSVDLGLMQINNAQLRGLSVADAFDACRNIAAGARHYVEDIQAVLHLAARRYNTGSIERGEPYASSVDRISVSLGSLPAIRQQETGGVAQPVVVQASAAPSPTPPAPSWDLFGRARGGSQSILSQHNR